MEEWRESKKFHTPPDIETEEHADQMLGKLMLVVSEVGEAAEAVRHKNVDNFREELADAIIRILDITSACDIDIYVELADKMDKNARRPIRHGKTGTTL